MKAFTLRQCQKGAEGLGLERRTQFSDPVPFGKWSTCLDGLIDCSTLLRRIDSTANERKIANARFQRVRTGNVHWSEVTNPETKSAGSADTCRLIVTYFRAELAATPRVRTTSPDAQRDQMLRA